MFKKLLTFIMLIFIIIGMAIGVYFAYFSEGATRRGKGKR